jgi:hypothetical protein
MAGDSSDRDAPAQSGEVHGEAPHEPRECMACRGTGQVISNLGGTPSRVTCPWCGGGGLRLAAVDAQSRWGEPDPDEPGRQEPPEPAS